MLNAKITINDLTLGVLREVPFTSDLIASLPTEAQFFGLPSVEIHNGGQFGSPAVADFTFAVPVFNQRDGSTYWIVSPGVGDIGQWTSMGLSSPYDNYAGGFTINWDAHNDFYFIERDSTGTEVQRVGPFTSQNP